MDNMMTVQCAGSVLGITGSYLVTSQTKDTRCIAFFLWIISNILIIMVYTRFEQWPLMLMGYCYLITSVLGFYRNRPQWDHHGRS